MVVAESRIRLRKKNNPWKSSSGTQCIGFVVVVSKINVNVHKLPLLQDSVKLTVHLLDLPDQVNTDLVKEGDKLDLQVKTKNTDLVKKRGTNLICMLKKKMNTDLARKRRTNLISRSKKSH
jgi:hypothetical protein